MKLALGCAAVMLAVAVILYRWLRTHSYRYADEQDLPARRHTWVLVGLPVAAFLVAHSLQFRWPTTLAVAYVVPLVPLTVMAAIDLDVRRLPNRLTYPFGPLCLAVAAVASIATGDWGAWVRALIGAAVLFVAYFVLMFVSPGGGGLGFGDVKLAVGVGALLGWFAWFDLLLGSLLSFVVGGLWALVLLATRRANRKSQIAFGPFMVLGTVLTLLVV